MNKIVFRSRLYMFPLVSYFVIRPENLHFKRTKLGVKTTKIFK